MAQPAQAPVLVGIDGSSASESATAIAFDEASRRNVGLIALHAWSDGDVSEWPGARLAGNAIDGRTGTGRASRGLAGAVPRCERAA